MNFMWKRAQLAKRMIFRSVNVKLRWVGILMGFTLTYLFWGSLLLQCGDIETNPGPTDNQTQPLGKTDTGPLLRSQTQSLLKVNAGKVTVGAVGGGTSQCPLRPTPELNLSDIMMKLVSMDSSVNAKLDSAAEDMAVFKQQFSQLREEVGVLKSEVDTLRHENQELRALSNDLLDKLGNLEKKTEDLEGRSKRNNLLFYGMIKDDDETNEDLEMSLKELCTDRLELSDDIHFDRVHRINNKPNSPVIARFSFFKQKQSVLKNKNKLKGSKIFIDEDYSRSVREIRKHLAVIMKRERAIGKRVSMVYDHLFVEGKRYGLGGDRTSLVELT